jgi:uncharacterized Zn finger protein (UPF0148 family)
MKKCRDCSYTPATEPKVFCPACGAVWFKAEPPKSTRAIKGEGQRKEKSRAKKTQLTITNVSVTANVPSASTTTGKAKRNPTKKG